MADTSLTESDASRVTPARRVAHRPDTALGTPAVRRTLLALLLLIAVLYPFYFSDYSNYQLARVFSLAIAVLSLNLLTGFTGVISVGHGALMGLGAYTMLILHDKADVPTPAGLVVAAVVCFAVGLALGFPSLRISGLYLALVTLGFAIIFPPLVKRFSDLTGGVTGINYTPPDAPFGLALTSAQWLYLITLAAMVVAMFAVRRLVRGRTGRALSAIRTNELMAAANGVPIGRTKVLVFATSAALAGVAGCLYQLVIGPVLPDAFVLTLSITLITAAVVGGVSTILGAVVGAAFVVYAPDYASDIGDRGPALVYAIALLVVVYFFRSGVVGGVEKAGHRLVAAWAARGSGHT